MFEGLIERIKGNPKLKKHILNFVVHPVKARPQWWIRLFMPLYIKRGKGSVIYRSVRKDVIPGRKFILGQNAVIEDWSAVNNCVGDVIFEDNTRLGLRSTVIGPVTVKKNTHIGQNCLIMGLIHYYDDAGISMIDQGVTPQEVIIGEDSYIGANCVVVAGVTIGKHCVIGAGSIVTESIPDYTVCAGAPAKAIKRYDFEKQQWVKIDRQK